ncbi:MAG: hypothetical protein HY791_15530 [Deltaproteobacteria bacterium]|nr:hypothetical protein [Deltaproteobacteria bacterium]
MALFAVLTSVVALRLDTSPEVTSETAAALSSELVSAIEGQTAASVVVDDIVWEPRCGVDCETEVRARTNADDVVLVRVLGALSLLRVVAVRSAGPGTLPKRLELELSAPSDLKAAARSIAQELFPKVAAWPPQPETAEAATFDPPPWILLSAGVAALAVGVGLGVSSQSLRREAETSNDVPTREVLESRASARAAVSVTSMVVAGTALLSAIIWLAW